MMGGEQDEMVDCGCVRSLTSKTKWWFVGVIEVIATRCNTLQRNATQYTALQHIVMHCDAL